MFKSFEDVKRVAEKFEKGKIIPARVLKACNKPTKKNNHVIKFGCDLYRIAGKNGNNILVADFNDKKTTSVIHIERLNFHLHCDGNPYSKGENLFVGSFGISNEKWIDNINKHVF